MTMRPYAISAVVALALGVAGCGPTPYEPAASPSDTGYLTEQLSEDRYRVSFEGNADTERETVETYLLYRAAEVAAKTGHPYFAVVEGEMEREVEVNRYMTMPGFYGYGARLYGPGFYGGFPYYTTSGYTPGPAVATTDSYEAMATVEVLEARPDGRRPVFETQRVLRTLGPQIERPDAG